MELGHCCWCGSDSLAAAPALIRSMSFRLVIPGRLLSSRARFRFANRRALSEKLAARGKNYFIASKLSFSDRTMIEARSARFGLSAS